MSKTSVMVQYTLPYCEFGSELQQARANALFEEADRHIKARTSPTAGVWRDSRGINEEEARDPNQPPLVQQWLDDYRRPHCWRIPGTVPSLQNDSVMYRLFTNTDSANEWVNFCESIGCYDVKIITEADRGVVPGVPATLADFPTDEHIASFMWTE